MSSRRRTPREGGFALVAVLLLMAMLMAILAVYSALTGVQLAITDSSIGSIRGFYAAEAGLNLRAEEIRQTFLGYNRPGGTAPLDGGGWVACDGANQGSGDFRCQTSSFSRRDVRTYVTEDPSNPASIVVPPGEAYANLSAQRYAYRVHSVAINPRGRPEAILDLEFNSQLVPLFQFAAFYDKDLEIHPGPPMTLGGPVHSNGDLYLGSSGGLDIAGQVTTSGRIYQGRKTDTTCYAGGVRVADPGSLTSLPSCPTAGLLLYDQADFAGWNGQIRTQIDPLTVPPANDFDATPGSWYWDSADMRVTLKLGDGPPRAELRWADGTVDVAGSAVLTACGPAGDRAIGISNSFYNLREGKAIDMLDVNVGRLLECLDQHSSLMGGKALDDATGGGLAWFISVDGPDSAGINGYGVRLTDAAELTGGAGAPTPLGLSVISDQAIYVHGDYNAVAKKPAAVMADSINVLSADYVDGDHALALSHADRKASATTINAAFLAGTDVTGGVEGPGGQGGSYNGGLENYPRLHENWSGVTLRYRGSFVSLDAPSHVMGPHTTPGLYSAPSRDWGFDSDFNDAANLPPLTPRFVYLRQDLFVRDYER